MREFARALIVCLAVVLCLLTPESALAQECNSAPTGAQKAEATNSMTAGVAFLQDPEGARHEDAYPQFKKAYEQSCSLNALQNLALCEMKLELDGAAIAHYEIVLAKKADLADADRGQISSDVAGLKQAVAWISLSADREGAKVVDSRSPNRGGTIRNNYVVGAAGSRLGIHPGLHLFTATLDGLTVKWQVDVKAGTQHTYKFDFAAAAEAAKSGKDPLIIGGDDGGINIPVTVWIAGGATVASAIVMGVMMGLSTAKKSDYDDNLQGKAPLQEQQDAVSSIQTLSLVADIFIGVTVAGAAATLVLALTAPPPDGEEAGKKQGPRFGVDYTVVPLVSETGGGAALTVQF